MGEGTCKGWLEMAQVRWCEARDGMGHEMVQGTRWRGAGDGSTQLEAVGSRQWGLGMGSKQQCSRQHRLDDTCEGWLEIA